MKLCPTDMPADRPYARIPSSTCFRGFHVCWTASWNCYPFGTSSSSILPCSHPSVVPCFYPIPCLSAPSHAISLHHMFLPSSFLSDPSSHSNSHPPPPQRGRRPYRPHHLHLRPPQVPSPHCWISLSQRRPLSAQTDTMHVLRRLIRESTLYQMSQLFARVLGLPWGC